MRISAYILLILIELPSIYLYSKNLDLNFLLLSILPIIYLWAIVKNSKCLICLYPFAIIVPPVVFYIHFYGASINEQILSIVLETNWQEALNFLGHKGYLYLSFFILWQLVITALFWYNSRLPVCWTHRSRWWVIISISASFAIGIIANEALVTQIESSFDKPSNNFLVEEKNSVLQELKQTYPLGLIISISDLYQEQRKINEAFSKRQHFTFQAGSLRVSQNKQLVVLVIGETSRRANWQLNGYARQTNPLLTQQSNLINFSDMLGVSAATRSAIPMLLTRKPESQVYQYDFPERSVLSAFKEAGFSTYWLSNQQKFGAYDTSTSVYAKEADNIIFLNKANYINHGETDDVILPEFKKILGSDINKKLIVIHTLGSHFDYSHRYPTEFDIFKPSLNDLNRYNLQDRQYKQHMVNSYDNSILFTDYVLNGLIESMKKENDTESFLLFSSDHGEDLFDNSCDKSGHGNETAYNFEIASFAWYSDSFATKNTNKVQNLKSNHNKKINQTAIFPTLIDAANIDIPNYERTRSLLTTWSPYPRLVLGGKDYDSSPPQGSCREIK